MVKAGSRPKLDRIDDDFLAHVGHRVFEHENELRLGAIAGQKVCWAQKANDVQAISGLTLCRAGMSTR
jgi:hypothetical protein